MRQNKDSEIVKEISQLQIVLFVILNMSKISSMMYLVGTEMTVFFFYTYILSKCYRKKVRE